MKRQKTSRSFANSIYRIVRLNAARFFREYYYATRKVKLGWPAYPMVNSIELTNFCNLQCPMCSRSNNARPIGYIDLDFMEHIVQENEACFQDYPVYLHYGGESLFHPKLDKAINILSSREKYTIISTNASILNEKKAYQIFEGGLSELILCLDSNDKDIFERYRKGATFEVVKENIIMFLELRKKLGLKKPFTRLQIIDLPETSSEVKKYVEYWKKFPVDQIFLKRFISRAGIPKYQSDNIVRQHYGSCRVPCDWFWKQIMILWDGRVTPCCQDLQGRLILGDLKTQTLKEIWNSKRLQRIRANEISGNYVEGLCDNCVDYRGYNSGVFSKPFRLKVFKNFDLTVPVEVVLFDRRSPRNAHHSTAVSS